MFCQFGAIVKDQQPIQRPCLGQVFLETDYLRKSASRKIDKRNKNIGEFQ